MQIFIYVLNEQFKAGDSSLSSQTRIEPYTHCKPDWIYIIPN
jgi:hypothetical protein